VVKVLRVLVADDSRVMRQIVVRTLRQAGYDWDVREAPDGAAALDMVREDEPDLVLSDWNMPEMTGIELLRAMRREGFETPFAFVTSEGSPEMRQTADEAGALFLIAKPFTADTFRDAIDPVLA
jgi:two-component system chemotaxis response regulator CheY